MSLLQETLADLYEDVPDGQWLPIWKSFDVDQETILARCGPVWTKALQFFDGGRFDFSDDGVASVVIEAIDADAETVIDIVAWPLDRPKQFATMFGRADILGLDQVTNPASYFYGGALRVYKTPESWLRADCTGCVPLNKAAAAPMLGDALGPIAAEDIDHGRELARMLHAFFDPGRILVPRRGRAA
jgi:hypothetical protein